MSNQQKILLFISLVMVFTQGLWERIFFMQPGSASILVELPVWLYLLTSYNSFKKRTPGRILFNLFLGISFFAGLANGSGTIAWLKYIRYFVYFYLIFQSLWHIPITQKQWFSIMKLIIFLILIQGVGSAFNLSVLNQRIEGHVGLMSSIGGTTASTFPLFVVSISLLFFIFHKNMGTKFDFILLLCVVSAILVGYASGKRAIFFSIPLFLAIILIVSFLQLKGSANFYKKITIIGLLVMSLIPVYIFGISMSHGFNYGLSGNENSKQVLLEAFTYAQEYENSTSKSSTTGRTGTTIQIVANSLENGDTFVFGNGYGSIKDESIKGEIGVIYGFVGFTRDILSAGWLVMLLTVLILFKIILTNRSINFNFSKAIRIAMLLIFVFTHFGYSSDFTVHLKISFLLAIICAFINSPVHASKLIFIVNKYFNLNRS